MQARNREQGVVLVFLAISLLGIFGVITMALNVGWLASVKAQAQAAVDAAALAGAAGLPVYNATGDPAVIDELAVSFNGEPDDNTTNTVAGQDPLIQIEPEANRNLPNPTVAEDNIVIGLYDATDIDVHGSGDPRISFISPSNYPDANAVTISKNYIVDLFMGGFSTPFQWSIPVTATAIVGSPSCFQPDLPVVLIHDDSDPNSLCNADCNDDFETKFTRSSPSTSDNAAFFNYSDEKATAKSCRADVACGMDRPLCVPEPINLNNGSFASCVSAGGPPHGVCDGSGQRKSSIKREFDAYQAANSGAPWPVTVPFVYESDLSGPNANANQIASVRGFVRIAITGVNEPGHQHIDGQIQYKRICGAVAPDSVAGGPACGLISEIPVLVR